jgi:hypothetical protein
MSRLFAKSWSIKDHTEHQGPLFRLSRLNDQLYLKEPWQIKKVENNKLKVEKKVVIVLFVNFTISTYIFIIEKEKKQSCWIRR